MPSSQPSPCAIETMFDRLAGRYDLFNRLTSMGQDGVWRRRAVERLKPGMRVLDLGCGTGDLSLEALRKVGHGGRVTGLDFSQAMIDIARRRSANAVFLRESAEALPLSGQVFDAVISGFVLRNIYQNIDPVLKGVYASLQSGGQISFLDFTEPPNRLWLVLWKAYMATAAALYGKILFGKDYPAGYMTESARRFVKPAEFTQKLERTGFKKIETEFFMFGIIVLYRAVKP